MGIYRLELLWAYIDWSYCGLGIYRLELFWAYIDWSYSGHI